MRICYLGRTGPFLRNLAEGVATRGAEVTVITFYDPNLGVYFDPAGWKGVQVLRLPHHLKWQYPRAARKIAVYLRQLNADVFHCHYAFPYGMYGASSLHRSFVLSLHGTDAYYQAWRMASGATRRLDEMGMGHPAFRTVHRLLARRTKLVSLGSPDLVAIAKELGYPEERLRECNIGVDTSTFCPGAPNMDLRHRLLAPFEEGYILLSARAFMSIYGYVDLLQALPTILREYPNTVLVLAGWGDPHGIVELANRLGVAKNVRIAGPIPHKEVAEYMRACDVLCSVAHSDTASMTVLEGMAVGLPILATKVGSIPVRIAKTDGGILVDPGNRTEIAEGLLTLIADADLRRAMGQRNQSYASTHLSFDETVRLTIAAYRELE